LLPIQEEAVKKYGVLNYYDGSKGLPRRCAPRNQTVSQLHLLQMNKI